MGPIVVEVASVAESGTMSLPKRIREALGMRDGGRVVFFANPKTRTATVVFEAACPVPPRTPRV